MLTQKFRFIVLLLSCLIASCHSPRNKQDEHVLTIHPTSHVTHLYYSGTIKPIREILVTSPANGILKKLNFHYGDFLAKNQLMLSIHSPDMENEFHESLGNYMRAKQAYLNSQKNMEGTEKLHQDKIISEQEYANEKSQYQSNLLTYIEANNKLQQFIEQLPEIKQRVTNVSLNNLENVKEILQSHLDDLSVYAKYTGIILYPDQKNDKPLAVGSDVKKGDLLGVIGDVSGLSLTVEITENDINLLKLGRKVVITFTAQPEIALQGVITSIAKQAISSENASFATFPVEIHIPHLNRETMQKVRVGMNAKIDIIIQEPSTIRVPINAITQANNKAWVTKIDPVTKKEKLCEVETGETSVNQVVVTKGLMPGEKIAIHD